MRRWLGRGVALGLGLLAAALVAELGWRAARYGPAALTPGGMNSIRPLGMSGLVRGSDVWELRFELVPEARSRFKLAAFETNAHGMRDLPRAIPEPSGTRRIAFLGDSFTMGSGVEREATFPARIEARLAERGRGAWECLNFGVGGYNLLSYVGVLRERAARFGPEVVVVCLTANDLKKPPQRPDLPPYTVRPTVRPFWTSHLLAHLAGRPPYADDGREDAGDALGEEPPATDHVPREPRTAGAARPEVDSTGADPTAEDSHAERREGARPPTDTPLSPHFRALRALADEAGAELAFVYLNLAREPYFSEVAPRLIRAEARAVDAPFYDTSPLFEGRDPRELWIFPDDPHPDAEAHGILAEGVVGFLHRRGLLER